jgi:TPR repeat protein
VVISTRNLAKPMAAKSLAILLMTMCAMAGVRDAWALQYFATVRCFSPSADITGGNYLPGKYFKLKADKYLDKDDPRQALEMYQHAAYYGNRDAQYALAMLYLKGADKVPIDIPRGVAWLQLAVAYKSTPAMDALQKISSGLSEAQRTAASEIFRKIGEDDSIDHTRQRVHARFVMERGVLIATANGNSSVCTPDGGSKRMDKYLAEKEEEYSDYYSTMYGTVDVGPLQSLPAPDHGK